MGVTHEKGPLHSIPLALKDDLYAIWMADSRAEAEKADTFAAKYEAKYPQAITCLIKDRTALLAFYDFPAEELGQHQDHQSHRERVRDGQESHRTQQGMPIKTALAPETP